jgi:hypothetical protein
VIWSISPVMTSRDFTDRETEFLSAVAGDRDGDRRCARMQAARRPVATGHCRCRRATPAAREWQGRTGAAGGSAIRRTVTVVLSVY